MRSDKYFIYQRVSDDNLSDNHAINCHAQVNEPKLSVYLFEVGNIQLVKSAIACAS
jgi:hypothetical protein